MSEQAQIVACPNPFTTERIDAVTIEGRSIAEVVYEVQPDPILAKCAHVHVNGGYVPISAWKTTYVFGGDLITVRMVPQGGGDDKNPLATILSIVVIALATVYGGPLGGVISNALGVGAEVGAAMGTALIGMAGAMAINALVPPPSQNLRSLSDSGAESNTLSIAGARNTSGINRVIPKIFGRHRVTPYYGAQPYTELVGQDQYLRLLFVIGYGPLKLEDFRIGETDIYTYDGVEIEYREGWDDDAPLSIYPGTVSQSSPGSTLSYAADWVEQTTAADVEEFGIEILFATGLVRYDSSGNKQTTSVDFEVEYKDVADSTWTQVDPVMNSGGVSYAVNTAPGKLWVSAEGGEGSTRVDAYRTTLIYINRQTGVFGTRSEESPTGYPGVSTPPNCYAVCQYRQYGYDKDVTSLVDVRDPALTGFAPTLTTSRLITIASGSFATDGVATISGRSASALRFGFVVRGLDKSQYDVRVRRTTADSTDDKTFDEAKWSVLRSIENTDPIQLDGLSTVALRIKATDQLQGIIDQFNLVASSIVTSWDSSSSTWVQTISDNPADLYREVFQGPGMKDPIADSKMDLTELTEWAEECEANGWAYNHVLDYATTPFEMAKNIAALGRATFAMKDGSYSVVRDSQDVYDRGAKQWITPRNSWDVKGTKSFDDIHGVSIDFINADEGYRPEQVTVYASGYDSDTATRVDTIELLGCTSHNQAARQGNYYLAVAALRPEVHSRSVDVEHLVCTRGDLIRVTDDVALHGLYTGRIKAIDGNDVTLDEAVTMESGKTYGARIRLGDGSGDVYRAVTLSVGSTDVITLAAAPTGAAVGDILMFGETDQETSLKIVQKVEMQDDLSARVSYVDANESIYDIDSTGTIPTYDPGTSVPVSPTVAKPAVPVVLDVRSDETASQINDDGTFTDRIMVSIIAGSGGTVNTASFEVQYRENGLNKNWLVLPPISASTGVCYIPEVIPTVTYDIRVRSISAYGLTSDWVETTETVEGRVATIAAVTNLAWDFSTVDCVVTWDHDDAAFDLAQYLAHYLIEVKDKTTDDVLYSAHLKQNWFVLPLAVNQTLTGGPLREFKLSVTVYDIFGRYSTAETVQPLNNQAATVAGLGDNESLGKVELYWTSVSDNTLAGYEIHVSETNGFTPSGTTLYATAGNKASNLFLNLAEGTYYVRVGAFDVFGPDSISYSAQYTLTVSSDTSASLYTWIKYADTAVGGGMSDSPTGKEYIGIAYNKASETESTDPADYAWSLIKGTDGANGSLYATAVLYKRTATDSAPSDPPYNFTYYWSSGVMSTGDWDGWSETVPSYDGSNPYLWTMSKIMVGDAGDATYVITPTAWSAPGKVTEVGAPGEDGTPGEAGQGQVKGFGFIRDDGDPSAPETPTGGSFASPTPTTSGWSDGIPTDDGNPVWVSTRLFTSDGETPQDATWSTPTRLVQTGLGTKLQFSVDGSTNWHDTPAVDDEYMRTGTSTDGGDNWTYSGAVKIKGETGTAIDGEDAYSISGTNENHTFVATSDGTASMTGYSCEFEILKGTTAYTYDGSSPYDDNSFRYGTITPTNVTQSVATDGTITLDAGSDIASGTSILTGGLIVPIYDNADNTLIATRYISFTKSVAGVNGATGARGGAVFTIDEADAGTTNIDSDTVTSWVGTLTDAYAQEVATDIIASWAPDGYLQPNDRITLSDAANEIAATRIYTGSATDTASTVGAADFDLVVQIFDGSVVVNGTLSAETLMADSTFTKNLNIGSLLTINTNGAIQTSNKTSYADDDAGVWLGYDNDAHKVNIGDASNYLKWTGTGIEIRGTLKIADGTALAGLAIKDSVDLSSTEVVNKSLANLDSAANTKLAGVAAGADVTIDQVQDTLVITSGGITMNAGGAIHSLNKDSYADTTPGFYLGYDTTESDYVIKLGDDVSFFGWDGADLTLENARMNLNGDSGFFEIGSSIPYVGYSRLTNLDSNLRYPFWWQDLGWYSGLNADNPTFYIQSRRSPDDDASHILRKSVHNSYSSNQSLSGWDEENGYFEGYRVLLHGQTAASQNGIWEVQSDGTLARPTDADAWGDYANGSQRQVVASIYGLYEVTWDTDSPSTPDSGTIDSTSIYYQEYHFESGATPKITAPIFDLKAYANPAMELRGYEHSELPVMWIEGCRRWQQVYIGANYEMYEGSGSLSDHHALRVQGLDSSTVYSSVVLGADNNTAIVVEEGNFAHNDCPVDTGATAVGLSSGNVMCLLSSSIRYKTAVQDLDLADAENIVYGARPVTYKQNPATTKSSAPDQVYLGIIAEEFELVDPRLISYSNETEEIVLPAVPASEEVRDEDGKLIAPAKPGRPEIKTKKVKPGTERVESVDYARFSVALIKVVQKQKELIDDLETRLSALENP